MSRTKGLLRSVKHRISRRLSKWIEAPGKGVLELESCLDGIHPEVISVDLFDTLVYRRCAQPNSVFTEQFTKIGCFLPVSFTSNDWVLLRKRVEDELVRAAHPYDVHIDEIYAKIGERLLFDAVIQERLKAAELDAEQGVIAPYLELVEVLRSLSSKGAVIVVTTDTYLPQPFLHSLLQRILPFQFDLLVSSETRMPKRTGLAFEELKRRYHGMKIVHIGDNLFSDVRSGRKAGLSTIYLRWPRPDWVDANNFYISYLADFGIHTFRTPLDVRWSDKASAARAELAWRWSIVLLDYLVAADAYAQAIEADEVWFLSRDSESLFRAASTVNSLFLGRSQKYVFCSRAATYPIAASLDPAKFRLWTSRKPTAEECARGKDMCECLSSLVSPSSKRILLLDTGWKGRIQVAIQMALPHVDVRGFYMSLDPTCEKQTRRAAEVFLRWDPVIINQAAIEALAGFRGPSCVGYRRDDNGIWAPEFRAPDSDRAPDDYCDALQDYLISNLRRLPAKLRSPNRSRRRHALMTILAYPNQLVAGAFWGWGIGAQVGEDSVGFLVEGGEASWLTKLFGRQKNGNLWPQVAMWSIATNRYVVWMFQSQVFARKLLIGFFDRTRSYFEGVR